MVYDNVWVKVSPDIDVRLLGVESVTRGNDRPIVLLVFSSLRRGGASMFFVAPTAVKSYSLFSISILGMKYLQAFHRSAISTSLDSELPGGSSGKPACSPSCN